MIKLTKFLTCLAMALNVGIIYADQHDVEDIDVIPLEEAEIQLGKLDVKDTGEEAQERYQGALMVYLTERYKLSSSRTSEQEHIDEQLNELNDQGITLLESAEQIPQELRGYFTEISENGKDKMAQLYFEDAGLSVRIFVDSKKKKVYVSFRGTDFSSVNSMISASLIAHPLVQFGKDTSTYYDRIITSIAYLSGNLLHPDAGRYDKKTGFVCTMPTAFQYAQEIATALKKHYHDFSIHPIGYSQGGAIALHLALNTDDIGKSHVFNTQIPAPCLIRGASEERFSKVVSTYVENDMLNDPSYSPLAVATWYFRHQGTEPFPSTKLPVDSELEKKITDTYNKAPSHKLSWYQQGMSVLNHGFIRHSPTAVLEATKYHYNIGR